MGTWRQFFYLVSEHWLWYTFAMEQTTTTTPTHVPPPPVERRRLLSWPGVVVVVVASCAFGFWMANLPVIERATGTGRVTNMNGEVPDFLNKDVSFDLFWEAWQLVQDEHLGGPVQETQLLYGALAGLVSGVGDPYTVFLDPQTATEFSQDLSGTFDGIGAEIGMREGQIVVIAPLRGTPAERAGVAAGDVVISINGEDTAGMTVENAVTRIRGEKGTDVRLDLYRPKSDERVSISVTRDTIVVESVVAEEKAGPAGQSVSYIRISHFNEDTAEQFQRAVDETLRKNPAGVIIDLRNNPGGFLDVAVSMAHQWVYENVVVIERGETEIAHRATGPSPLRETKTVVLVNEGSASASEILAGALQDYGLATIIGTQTFGKGTVQALRDLSDGSAIKITVAEWLTPKGRSIEKEGIAPDVVVEDAEGDDDEQLAGALKALFP